MAEDAGVDRSYRNAPALGAAFADWADEAGLAPALADPASPALILDPQGVRLLHVAPGGRALAALLAPGGGLDPALSGRIAQAAGPGMRLVRLRLDPRGIAPPTLCTVARAANGAVLVLAAGPMPRPRPGAAFVVPAVPELPEAPPPADLPAAGTRILWRSDPEGRLTFVSAPLDFLTGANWQSLAAAGRLDGAGSLVDALGREATFRGLGATLRVGASSLVLDLSGAPLARSGQPFSGFSGFAVVRETALHPAPAADGAAAVARAPEEPEAAPIALDPAPEPGPVPEPMAAPYALPPPEKAPAEACLAETEPTLSVTEHAAFREIARALGVRYAGDEPHPAAPEAAAPPEAGAVTPFPGPRITGEAQADALALLEGVPAPLLIHRGDAVLAANRALLELTGFGTLADLQREGLGGLFRGRHPAMAGGETDEPVAIRAADGTGRPVALERAAMPWPEGPATCLLLRPLPEGRMAEPPAEPRADLEAESRALLDGLPEAVASLDAAGRVLGLNRAAAALLGCEPREVIGLPFAGLFGEGEAVGEAIARADGEARTVTVAGHACDLRVAEAGALRVALLRRASVRTVTRVPPRFLAKLDHGIRTPMTGILGFADVMLKEPYGPLGHDRYRGYLADIRASGEQMLGLVDDLIDLAAIEAGTLGLSFRPLALNDLVSACVADLQAEAARSRIVLRTSLGADLGPLEADEGSLVRATRIVLGNAIRLTGAGGQVIVSTTAAERDAVALRVRDSGAGMSAEEIAAALAPFGGVPGGTYPDGGLGLPLTKALVEANRGRLRLSSRKDEGTLVEILLPARQAKRA